MTIETTYDYAKEILKKYNLDNWKVSINNENNKFGSCSYIEKTIRISKYHIQLNTDYEVKRTILHEIAHALNPYDGHHRKWRLNFQKLLQVELGSNEVVHNRFGKGRLPGKLEKKELDGFQLLLISEKKTNGHSNNNITNNLFSIPVSANVSEDSNTSVKETDLSKDWFNL